MSKLLDIQGASSSTETLIIEEPFSLPVVPPPRINNKLSIDNNNTSGRLSTIDFGEFATLLNPKNVECCICCSTNLLSSSPPSLFIERKTEILKSFCDILNLPFSFNTNINDGCNSDGEEEIEETDDFPFCFHCTNHKVIKLTMLFDKLQHLQGQFDTLKEAIMKDILRVFLNNMVMDKKIPIKMLRETRTHDRMFNLFKRHSERKTARNAKDSESQTEPFYFPTSSIPVPVAAANNVVDSLGNANKRRKIACRKYENYVMDKPWRRKSTTNSRHPFSPVNEYSDVSSEIIHKPEYNVHSNDNKQNQSSMDESASVDSVINGGVFSFGDNGLLDLDQRYLSNIDFVHSFDTKGNNNSIINGRSSLDHSTLRDEFHHVLGLVDGLETDGSVTVEVPIEPIVGRKSSPYISGDNFRSKSKRNKTYSRSTIGKCEICDKSMLRSTLKMHMEQIHGNVKPYACRGCDKKFARRDHYYQHEERHIINHKRLYFCHRCGADSESICSKTAYISHCVTAHNIEDDVVEYFHFCDADNCNESYKIREDFLNHLGTHREPGVNLKCSVCEKSFAEKKRLDAHEREAHRSNEPFYDCQFCYKGFEEETDFSRHILFHKVKIPEELVHFCDLCEKSFETVNRLRRHKYSTHVRKRSKKSKSAISSTSQNDEITSEVAPVSVPEATLTVVSPENVEVIETETTLLNDQPDLTCETCGKTFIHEKRLKKHLLKHLPLLEEEVNEKVEPVKLGKLMNIRMGEAAKTVNSNTSNFRPEKTLACKYCRKKFRSSHETRRHMVKSHPDEHLVGEIQSCIVCYHLFNNADDLEEHYNEKHSRFKCPDCEKQCINTQFLNLHMKSHHKVKSAHTTKRGKGKKKKKPASDDSEEEEDKDMDELRNALSPVNHFLYDQDSYDMMDLFQSQN